MSGPGHAESKMTEACHAMIGMKDQAPPRLLPLVAAGYSLGGSEEELAGLLKELGEMR